jgi:branched-chain amino acid transport system substrate-binding protein
MLSKKYLIGAMILLFLVVGLFSSFHVAKASPVIKIGIFGPKSIPHYPHWEAGMYTAAEMLKEQINGAGGWTIGGTTYTIEMYYADEYTQDPSRTADIEASVDYLCSTVGVNFIIGGFRTECVEYAIDYWHEQGYNASIPWFINGASTSELLSTTVGVDHDSWKYLYRSMPTNSTALFSTFAASIKTYLCSDTGILTNLFGKVLWPGGPKQVKTAVIMENLEWTNVMWNYMTNPAIYPAVLGPHVNVTYSTRLYCADTQPDKFNPADVEAAIAAAKAAGCNLLIHVFSGSTGKYLMQYYHDLQLPALPVGINVVSQTKGMWTATGGKCEYESHLMAMGTRSPLTPELTQFWDDFLAWSQAHLGITDNWPVYTAVGVGNALITIKTAAQAVGSLNPEAIHNYLCPRANPSAQPIKVLTGLAKFDATHDVYQSTYDYSAYWTGYARSWVVQWLDARLELVYPSKFLANMSDIPFAKIWCLPPWMYTLIWDITYDGYVGVDDVVGAAENFGAEPGTPRWDHRSDVTFDNYVGVDDIVGIAEHFGSEWPGPP